MIRIKFIAMIFFFTVGVISLLVSAWYRYLHVAFEREGDAVAKTLGFRKSVKRKKNVKFWTTRYNHPSRVWTVKDWRKGTYEYTVNNKTYKKHDISYDDPTGLPYTVPIVYLKRFPGISHINTIGNPRAFDISSWVALSIGVLELLSGVYCLINA